MDDDSGVLDDDSGVLGNLPRSRPGTRSQKRDVEARAASSAERRDAPAARTSAQARKRPTPPPSAPEAQGGDPVGEAVRTAAKLAGGGFKLANGLTREVLKRLPKP